MDLKCSVKQLNIKKYLSTLKYDYRKQQALKIEKNLQFVLLVCGVVDGGGGQAHIARELRDALTRLTKRLCCTVTTARQPPCCVCLATQLLHHLTKHIMIASFGS